MQKYGVEHFSQLHISKETLRKLNNPEWLKEQNHIQRRNCKKIADSLGDVQCSSVIKYFQRYNISLKIFSSGSSSIGERELGSFIKSIYFNEIVTNTKSIIFPLELDIYIPELGLAFEYNGEYWHKEGFMKPVGYHRTKTSLCRTKGIKLYHIWERHWGITRKR